MNQKLKGWAGLVLTILPLLHFIPYPAIQAVIGPVSDLILALLGVSGAAMAASSPAVIGKNK